MITNNIMIWRTINTLFIIILFSMVGCDSIKTSRKDVTIFKSFLDDYMKEYDQRSVKFDEELFAILIEKSDNYFLMDAPEEFVLGTLSEIQSKESQYSVGVYKGIYCVYVEKHLRMPADFFEEPDTHFTEKAVRGDSITIADGVRVKINFENHNWEPFLKIEYGDYKKVLHDYTD